MTARAAALTPSYLKFNSALVRKPQSLATAGQVLTADGVGQTNWANVKGSDINSTGSSAGMVLTSNGVGGSNFTSIDSTASVANFTGVLAGDVTGTQTATIISVIGGVPAGNIAAGATLANAADSANTPGAIIKRDPNGNFSAGAISASLTGNVNGNLTGDVTGNLTGNVSGSATSFSGPLAGDVTGTQSATTVAIIGGVTAANVATGSNLANAADSANSFETIVKRDLGGNFSAGTITANLTGNVTGNVSGSAGSATSFSGSLAGNVTGTQTATVVSTVGGVTAVNVASGANLANAATDSNTANAIVKRDGLGAFSAGAISASNINVTGSLSIPATTSATSGVLLQNGSVLLQTIGTRNTFLGANAGSVSSTGNGNNTGVGDSALQSISVGIGNSAFGARAMMNHSSGSQNSVVGNFALFASTSTSNNTAMGYNALSGQSTGTNNIAIGANAGTALGNGNNNNVDIGNTGQSGDSGVVRIGTSQSVTYLSGVVRADDGITIQKGTSATFVVEPRPSNTGIINYFIGALAGSSNTSGGANIFIGNAAGQDNVTNAQNTFIGANAGIHNSADFNTVVGSFAGVGTGFTGAQNTFIGQAAGNINSSGANNTFIGQAAGSNNTTGANNIALGTNAGGNLSTGNNNIDIGNAGNVGENNVIRMGTGQAAAFIAGIRGVTTGVNNAMTVVIDSNGQLGTMSSSRRYKEDIAPMGDASSRLQALRPVTFRYKKAFANGEKPLQFGLIAEEVATTFPELTVFNAEGKPESVKYQDLASMLLNEYQKEHQRAEQAQQNMKRQEQKINALETRLNQLIDSMGKAAK